jgi:hypothetical protein
VGFCLEIEGISSSVFGYLDVGKRVKGKAGGIESVDWGGELSVFEGSWRERED